MVSLHTPPAAAAVTPRRLNRRLWWLGLAQVSLGLVVLAVARIPVGIPTGQIPFVAAIAVVVAVQSVVRVDRGSPHRRIYESFWEVPLVIALCTLSPMAVLVGFMLGEIVGCFLLPSMTFPKAFSNLTREFAILPILIAVVMRLNSVIPPDQHRGILVPFAVWIVPDALRIAIFPVSSWARWGEVRWGLVTDYVATSSHRLMGALLGYFIVLGADENVALLVGTLVMLAVFISVVRQATVAQSLSVGFEMMARFADRIQGACHRADVERILIDTVSDIGAFETYAVAHPDGDGGVRWTGVVHAATKRELARFDSVVASATDKPIRNPAGRGELGVWRIDEWGTAYLVAAHRDRRDFRASAPTLDHLVSHARVAIAAVHDRRALIDSAQREHHRARLDERTNLPNRLAAEEYLDALLAGDPDWSVTLLGVSLVGVPKAVAVLGHEVGNQAVAMFAERLAWKSAVNAGVKYVASIGLNEFLVVFTGAASEVNNLAQDLASPGGRSASGLDAFVGYSEAAVGLVSSTSGQGATGDELLRRLDQAVERAGALGRVVTFGQRDVDDEARRMAIRLRLPAAIAHGDVVPYFQPQIDLVTGCLAGVEVLARWHDASLGRLEPGEFIAIAEQSGQIDALAVSVATQAVAACQRWRATGIYVPISVNISALSLARDDLPERIAQLVGRHNLPVGLVTIELTESSLATGSNSSLTALRRLKEGGFKISIDDFGTGYSALSYLDKLPIHEIKIDRSMVMGLAPADSRLPVIRKLRELCSELGFRVVAEGVETQEELSMLRNVGCDVGQGYLFARPMDEDEMTAWLAEQRLGMAELLQLAADNAATARRRVRS